MNFGSGITFEDFFGYKNSYFHSSTESIEIDTESNHFDSITETINVDIISSDKVVNEDLFDTSFDNQTTLNICEEKNKLYNVIDWKSNKYILRIPIGIQVENESNYYIFEYKPLNILAYGKTINEAESNFFEQFDILYHAIAKEEDNNLHESALQIKKLLMEFLQQ